jgi:hypothetical protein
MPNIEFIPDRAGLGALLRGPEIHELVMDRARGGAQYAARIAPVDTGEYAASIHADDGGLGGPRHDRAVGLVVASAPHAAAVEWGNAARDQAHHVLARTIDAIEAG